MTRHVLMPHPGLSKGIGYYLSGMEEVRSQLTDAVKVIPDDQIGKPAFLGAHSIGGLVLHIGEAEWFWMQMVVGGHGVLSWSRYRRPLYSAGSPLPLVEGSPTRIRLSVH